MPAAARWPYTRWASATEWVEHGTPAQLYALCGYDEEGILRALLAAGK